mmetsp:Transcript_10255/g.24910  ORF Transcript_10255/g.24910 Transcript_10255/m.24910 type:complete len:82 (-) Transcript_10255:286-531(-)
MISIDGVQSAAALFGNEYRTIKRIPRSEEDPDLFEETNPAAIVDVARVLSSPLENPGDEEDALFLEKLPSEQSFSSAEITI